MIKSRRGIKSPRARNSLILKKSSARSQTAAPTANIKVVVRVRPPNEKEQVDNQKIVVKILDDQMLVFDPKENSQGFFYHGVQQKGRDLLKKPNKNLQFMYDRIFSYETTNTEVFEGTTQNMIKSLMDGYNCSVFAYGATGAGKTHTMLGNCENPGITYLTMTHLFKMKEELSHERNFEIGISYLEIYNELVQNLLNPGRPLQLMEDAKYGVIVSGLKINKIEDPNDLFRLLEKGNSNRTQHPTDANAESSRSHAVFQVYIQMENKTTKEIRAAKLSMIDLAGSERGAATGFVGARFTEGANINKSLLALGNCINSLADGQRHIPYRDSKLTRLLKDSLGGNCQTVMIANISPSSLSYEDTYNTLKYATRAKKIKSNMKRNIVNKELHINQYIKIVEDLNKEVDKLKKELREKKIVQEIDPNLSNELLKLFDERKKTLERTFNIEQCEQITILRRQLKEEADSRLSGLCIDTPEREEGHRRLGNTVNRFQRREDVYKNELANLNKMKLDLENQTLEFVMKNPVLQQLSEHHNMKLSQIECQYKVELEQKKNSLLKEELKSQGNLLEKMSDMLQPCFLQLRGHGLATEVLLKDYQGLTRHLQGLKNISWFDNNQTDINSPISVESETENEAIKDTIIDAEEANPLNGTFVLEPSKPKLKICAEQLMPKVYRRTPPRKVTKSNPTTSRIKENKPYRSPLGPSQSVAKVQPRTAHSHRPTTTIKKPFRT